MGDAAYVSLSSEYIEIEISFYQRKDPAWHLRVPKGG